MSNEQKQAVQSFRINVRKAIAERVQGDLREMLLRQVDQAYRETEEEFKKVKVGTKGE